ncbi:Alpha/Beta hydrolase protein [Ilyonectria sp. MPI-CAGE-AT-0026]|nr:Alpha/Beta hydrolase protein [Ilyonectria sp. MPI-CAGE-AT-0026]
MATSIGDNTIIFGDSRQPKALPLSHPKARWGEFGTEQMVLPKGYTRRKGCVPLPCDIIFERDTPVKLRDGTNIYVDIYRPVEESATCPALIAWSPYGKQGGRGNQVLDDFPFRMGIPLRKLSELQKWEGPDPGYWVQHGYAVVNPDPRGVGKSSGNIYHFGSQEGRDGADVVDWIGQRPWCSGKVALTGNSYLSISQWFIAAERPTHLAAIAPWEGMSDLYREATVLGGVLSKPALEFNLQLLQVNAGENSWENAVAMAVNSKLFGSYHNDKRAKVENITVPAYVVASWSNPIHTYGTFCGYHRLKSDKWLRVHDTFEWPDYYQEDNVADLHRFFDKFLKDVDNGWETTTRFRAKILDTACPLAKNGTDFQSTAFPPLETKSLKLFLDGSSGALVPTCPASHRLEYKASNGEIVLTYTFTDDAILCGPLQLFLAVSILGAQDSDIFVTCEKILTGGGSGTQLIVPFEHSYQSSIVRIGHRVGLASDAGALFYKGPKGQIRVSRRTQEPDHQVPGLPTFRMDEYHPLSENEIVQVQVPLTPIGMRFSKGEKFKIRLSGINRSVYPPVDQASLTVEGLEDININATVSLHTGLEGDLESYIILPCIQT